MGDASPNEGVAPEGVLQKIRGRMAGPGGYYNIGNAFGLVTAFWLQVITTQSTDMTGFFIGDPSAVAMTVAMVIFFWSGELYHRAWSGPLVPDHALNKRGDVTSAYGAMALGVGLLFLGQPVLAATAGFLHAVGKFGSAYPVPALTRGWPAQWPDLWRSLVLVSRVPATIAVLIEIARGLGGPSAAVDLPAPMSLLVCYLLWIKADLLLFRSKS